MIEIMAKRTNAGLHRFRLIWILPFILLPFCGFPNGALNSLLLQDLARIVLLPLGFLYLLSASRTASKQLSIGLYLILFIFGANWISLYFTSLDFNIAALSSPLKLLVFLIALILMPTIGILYLFEVIPDKSIRKLYLVPIVIVMVVSIIQVLVLLRIDLPITQWYKGIGFTFLEGSWTGLARSKPNVLTEFRVLSTFREPSDLASFMLLYALPFQLSAFLTHQYCINRVSDFALLVISLAVIVFTFSTTSYGIASIDVVLFMFIYLKRAKSISGYLFITLFVIVMFWIVSTQIDEYVRIISRAFGATSTSSQTRLGSIHGAFQLFVDNPFGVGFPNEKNLLYNYLPFWGKTIETSFDFSQIHSTFFRYLADFGVFWLGLFFGVFIVILNKYVLVSKYLESTQKSILLFWSINLFSIIFISGVEITSAWFLASCIFVFKPLFILKTQLAGK